MRESYAVRINSDRIAKQLERKGKTPYKASLEMGYSRNFLYNAMTVGTMRRSSLFSLAAYLGVDQDYLIVEDEPEKTPLEEYAESKAEQIGLDDLIKKLDEVDKTLLLINETLQEGIRCLR